MLSSQNTNADGDDRNVVIKNLSIDYICMHFRKQVIIIEPNISQTQMLTDFYHAIPTIFFAWVIVCSVAGVIGLLIVNRKSNQSSRKKLF